MSYGLLFRDEAPTAGWGFLWGSVFGTIWWYLGPMTLLPLLLTGECDWSNDAASQLLPSLLGHLVYGGVTALAFFAFERRRMRRLMADPRVAAERAEARQTGRNRGPRVIVLGGGARRAASDPAGVRRVGR